MRLYVSASRTEAGCALCHSRCPPRAAMTVMPLVFSPDGSRLLATTTTGTSCTLFLVEVLSAAQVTRRQRLQRASGRPTAGASPRSPPRRREIVFDTTGRRRFSLPGTRAALVGAGPPGGRQRRGHETTVRRRARRGCSPACRGAAAGWSADGSRLVLTRPGAILLADSLSRGGHGCSCAARRPGRPRLSRSRQTVHLSATSAPPAPASWRFP